ncbi:MAG: SDR family oxidoreductase [Planctomycetia bacterium]|jgi:short-subunit dehydrogenase
MKREIKGMRTIITGASSGIGRALAIEMARHGARLVVTARREERLAELVASIRETGGEVHAVTGDITSDQLRQKLIETATTQYGGLDILVNNAGAGVEGLFEDADPARARTVMELNYFAPIELIRLALPQLREGNRPMIVNVSSIVGLRATPYYSEYVASKFAIQGFGDSLRAELSKYPIDVLAVCPGTTKTEFFDVVIEHTGKPNWPEHKPVTPEAVARATVRAMRKGRHTIVPYTWGKVLWWLNRFSPGLVDRIMKKYV